MRIRSSLGARVALLSVALAGLVLLAFGATTLALIRQMRLDNLDGDIRARVHPALSQPPDPKRWPELERALRYSIGAGQQGTVVLLVRDRKGQVQYRSPEWPKGLEAESLPAPGPVPEGDDRRASKNRPEPGNGPDAQREAGPSPRRPPPNEPPFDGRLERMRLSRPVFVTLTADARRWRVGVMGNQDITMAVAAEMGKFEAEMRQTGAAFVLALPVALLLIAAGGWLIVRRALRPIEALTRTAERITAKGLDQRIATAGAHAEFQRLITVFNEMMDRLQGSFEQAVRFSADAAHELRTPLTILQGKLEAALHDAEDGSPLQRGMSELLDEVQRLKAIIQKLLLFSMADTGQLKLNLETFDLSAALDEIEDDMRLVAPGLVIEKAIEPGVRVMADAVLLPQALQNLASNAIKYTPNGGTVALRLDKEAAQVRFVISNTWEGTPPIDPKRVFNRFYRGDESHNRGRDGVGLGLSLSREIARAHQGDLAMGDPCDGRITFTMTLPAAP